MRVLVTGGAGFVGSFFCDRLLAVGHEVRLLDTLDPQVHPGGLPPYLAPQAELLVGDIRAREQCVKALEGVDVVMHAAAAVGVAQSLYKWSIMWTSMSGGLQPFWSAWRSVSARSVS